MVLAGAEALAVPSRFGQSLEILASEKAGISWKSIAVDDSIWYEDTFTISDIVQFEDVSGENKNIRETLLNILKVAKQLNPSFLNDAKGYEVVSRLNFDRQWGLGTSSTLINNIAQWAEVDAFKLLDKSFGGSGYDIAAAQNDSPILYRIENGHPKIEKIKIHWNFTDKLFFVYLNRKQDSKEGINRFRLASVGVEHLQTISTITRAILDTKDLTSFEQSLQKHEEFISEILKIPTIKKQLFSDYPNSIKSLGAWGGDFILAVGDEADRDYFRKKGYSTVLSYSEMVK